MYPPKPSYDVIITDIDHEGRGVGRLDNGKTVFVPGTLPGETVRINIKKDKPSFSLGYLLKVVKSSNQRVTPLCSHFNVCGGCSLQHLHPDAQVAIKQRSLEETLARIGNVRPDHLLTPIYGPSWGYRKRARLSVHYLVEKDSMQIGFRRKNSIFILGLDECHVLPPEVSTLLPNLAKLLHGISIRDRIPQIEVAVPTTNESNKRIVLVLRILNPLSDADLLMLRNFADHYPVQWWLQTKGPETVTAYYPLENRLAYSLPDFGLEYDYYPTEFTQVNSQMNQVMVRKAIQLLDPKPGELIFDFFCGLGNFTLPIARQGAHVLGLEGSADLVKRAQANAALHQLHQLARFERLNLFEVKEEDFQRWGTPAGAVLDPPRDGAFELVKNLPSEGYSRLVYISCNPATLARDASILVHKKGYTLESAGVMNMFPHTTHTESIAVFRRM
ncbi:MAG: 23S rRNA (uracil(1939)-C(5))-methyltransferase RlmD [Pseudomonadota bacterium]